MMQQNCPNIFLFFFISYPFLVKLAISVKISFTCWTLPLAKTENFNYILNLIFLSPPTNIKFLRSLYVLCKISIWTDDTAVNSQCDKPSDLLQQVEIAHKLQFDHKNQNCWKMFLFFISYILILKRSDLALKVIYSSSNIKSCYPDLI